MIDLIDMKIYSENKKAEFNYEVLEKYEAGLVLFGQEVKSIKAGNAHLAGCYVVFRAMEPYLVGLKVPPWQPRNAGANYNEERERKLLLNKKEINFLSGRAKEKGFSLIPLKIYEKSGKLKLEFGVAKGKKQYNKKEKIKKRDLEREVNRELSQ